MNQREALATRRRLLVASATLQRARLAHEWNGLRDACQPRRWAPAAAAAIVLAALGSAIGRHRGAPAWAARALMLWRLARAVMHWRQDAAAPPPR